MKSFVIFIFIVVAMLDSSVLGLRSHKHSVDDEDDSSNGHAMKRPQDGMSIEAAERRTHDADASDALCQMMKVFLGTFNSNPQESENYPRSWDDRMPQTLEVNANTVLHAIENFLSSSKVKKITRDLARKAAVVYRAIEKEF